MINLSDEYRIVTDPHNIILEQYMAIGAPKNKRKANPRKEWKEIGYFSSIKNAFKAYVNLDLKEATSLEDLVIRISKFEKRVDELFELKNLKV